LGTFSSELTPHAEGLTNHPRVYADANVPAGVVAFMRQRLGWDVLFVLEHADLRRARDGEHFRLARQLGRTLLTQDRDYVDDRRFPPDESGGVIVISAPDERLLIKVLVRIDRIVFKSRRRRAAVRPGTPPLIGRKLRADVDWPPPRNRKR
jgi:hypothetical protein